MKRINLLKPMLFAFLAFATLSCDDDDPAPTPQSNTIAAIAQRSPDLSILVQALVKADLVSVLNGTDDYTVFAPTNVAFTAFLTANNIPSLDDVSVPVLREILLNHVVVGTQLGADLPEADYIKTLAKGSASSTNTLSMYVNKSAGVRLNGVSSVTTPNISASNGVIHIVDAVIGLPTVVTFATADPTFDLLQAALTRDGDDLTDFVAVLSGTGPFTVFAPTNDAFTSLLADDLGGIGLADIPESTLDAVLKYHVASGNVLSSMLTSPGDTPVTSIQGSVFTITLPGTGGNIANITANGGRTSGIIAVDVQAANGVIHVINKVLLP
jgi:uncharacterized surface protein with fasciclin (FAS1) repeats